jgi:phenylacetic acid degradation operon negative regulatory protein
MSLKSATERLVAEFSARPTMRAGSLIITVFGDAVMPRGGTVWIGSLIRVLADFGINERLVRTSVFRLTRDGWLVAEQSGRRSYYSLSEDGAERFRQATARIYGDPRQTWAGDWCLVMLTGLDGELRESVRRELGWLGFGAISSNVLAHPSPDFDALETTLHRFGVDRQLVVMRGRTLGEKQDEALRSLVRKSWNLDEIDARYAAFVKQFRPLLRAATKCREPDEHLAFVIRTLLIQEYRRILLRDPLLPAEMLPAKWKGTAAYHLCQELYRCVYRPADSFMSSEFEIAQGPFPEPGAAFYKRFGGLKRGK